MAGHLTDSKVLIVLLGGFDPSAAMPVRLGETEAIRLDEAAAAKFALLIPGQAVEYALTWCTLSATTNRIAIQTDTPPFVKIADLAQKIVGELMPKSFVTQFGINRQYTVKFSSGKERDAFGTRIVPPNAWGSWGKAIQDDIAASSTLNHGGVVNVTMRGTPIAGRSCGWRDVQIAASLTGPDAALMLNDHFERPDIGEITGLEVQEIVGRTTSALMTVLSEQFDNSLNSLEATAQDIVQG